MTTWWCSPTSPSSRSRSTSPGRETAKRRAEETLAREPENEDALAALARAETRLKVASS